MESVQKSKQLTISLSQGDETAFSHSFQISKAKLIKSSTRCLWCNSTISYKRQKYGALYCALPRDCYQQARNKLKSARKAEARSAKFTEAERFLDANPGFYNNLVKKALDFKLEYGYLSYSFNTLVGILREEYKRSNVAISIDNSLRPYFARIIMEREPRLAGFFEVRGD